MHWAAGQSALAGLIMLGGGIFLLLNGFRFAKFVLMLTGAAVGFAVGSVLGVALGTSAFLAGIVSAALLGLCAVRTFRFGLGITAAATFALTLFLFCDLLGAGRSACMIGALAGAGFGIALLWVMVGSLTALVTAINGSSLALLGFVATANTVLPSMGQTFVDTATSVPLILPVLVAMAVVTGFTYQSNMMQGSIVTGTVRSESPVALR
ncbi:MAG: hypothetical protein HY248_00150 [Fimbriimonas ginsengisoli]|nr:hypothetical protein [Fimbriimonas ginsengisoli]